MAIAISGNEWQMASEYTPHTAHQLPGSDGQQWAVSWLPGRTLNWNAATTAMVIAETFARHPGLRPGNRLWPFVQGWSAELGLTADQVIGLMAQPLNSGGA